MSRELSGAIITLIGATIIVMSQLVQETSIVVGILLGAAGGTLLGRGIMKAIMGPGSKD